MISIQLKNPLKILGEDELFRIHVAALEILENTGIIRH